MSADRPTRLRCAIYTRKSSEEGLDQAFNSLDAQRESCEAYIKSQAGEGWHLVRTGYDDGGVSGGTLDRPALRHLLADIKARKVDTVVAYKVGLYQCEILVLADRLRQWGANWSWPKPKPATSWAVTNTSRRSRISRPFLATRRIGRMRRICGAISCT